LNKRPLVSVITPLYNYEAYIATAIESVLNQTYPHLEMIVVDDGSSDRGPEKVAAYAPYGVKLIRQPRHGYGVARALNLAIAHAHGEYISWLSADDYYLPQKIERNLEVFEAQHAERPTLGLLHSRPGLESSDPTYLKEYCPLSQEEQQAQLKNLGHVRWTLDWEMKNEQDLLFFSLFHNGINGCTTFIPKSVFSQVGPFRNSWPITQDYDMWLRILLAGYEVCYVPEVLTISRFHPVNAGFYKTGLMGAETDLLIQAVREYIELETPEKLQKLMPGRRIESLSTTYLERMLADGLYAQALWELTRQSHALTVDLHQRKQALTALIQPLELPPLQWTETLTWGITLTANTLQAPCLLAVLTEFCAAFRATDNVHLSVWAAPDIQPELPQLIHKWRIAISTHLQRPVDDLPGISGGENSARLFERLISSSPPDNTDRQLVEALTQMQIYIPVSSPDPLEQRCIFSWRSQARLVQWHAERSDFTRIYHYHQGLRHWRLKPDVEQFKYLQHKATEAVLFHEQAEQLFIFYQHHWWRLDTSHEFLRTLHPLQSTSTQPVQWSALPVTGYPYWPDWLAHTTETFQFEEVTGRVVSTLYTSGNQSHWQESLQAFLNTALNHPDYSFVLIATVAEHAAESVQTDILNVFHTAGINPDQVDNIALLCLEKPNWSALFQACWLWMLPMETGDLWRSLWPALSQEQTRLISLDWLDPSLYPHCWLSSECTVHALSQILQAALTHSLSTHERLGHRPAPPHPGREQWFKACLSRHQPPTT
jgi:teichuronic acid biosynthesis glycosyltransferase TuaG